MSWDHDYADDGDAANSAAVNAPFLAAQVWIDDLGPAAIRDGCFNHHQAATIFQVPVSSGLNINAGTHTYDFATLGSQMVWTTYGDDGNTERVVIGALGNFSGPYSGPTIAQPTSSYEVGTGEGDGVHGILILANLQVVDFVRTSNTEDPMTLVVGIQIQLDSGSWFTVDESEMAWSLDDRRVNASVLPSLDFDAATVCYVDTDEVQKHGASDANVTSVRLVFAVEGAGSDFEITFERVNLSVIPMYADDL